MHCLEVLHFLLSKKNSNVMVDGPDAFRHMLLERSAEHGISPSTPRGTWEHTCGGGIFIVGRGEHKCIERDRCKRQESDGYGFKCGYSLGLGSLHRIQVDAARAAFKLSRGHNGPLAMLAPWHASSNIDPAFGLRHHVDHDMGRRSQRGFRRHGDDAGSSQRSTETAGGAEAATGLCHRRSCDRSPDPRSLHP